jgi:hypothetical protein
MKPNKKYYDDALENFEELYKSDEIDWLNEYLEFSRFIQGLFIQEGGYIIYTGNFQAVNMELMWRVKEKVEKNPLQWSRFMIG